MSAERGRFPQPTPIDKTRFLPPRDLPQAVRPLPHGTTPLTDSQLPKMAELRRRSVGDVLRLQIQLAAIIPLALAASRLATTDGKNTDHNARRRFISAAQWLELRSQQEIDDSVPASAHTDEGDFTTDIDARVDAELAARKARGGKGIGRPPRGPRV
jgi:hypothetical protein